MEVQTEQIAPWKYVLKVTFYHVITYIVCGIIFSTLFNYRELFNMGSMAYYMQPVDSSSTLMGPLFQIVRGLIFGLVLLLLRDYIRTEKLGFLKLFALIFVFGIINTPGPAPSSIEGMIYTKTPWQVHLLGAPEIIVQTFLFSWLVSNIDKEKKKMPEIIKKSLITTIICVVGYSLCGIIIAALRHVDVMNKASDTQSYITLGISGALCFILAYWYVKKQKENRAIFSVAFYLALYIICAVYPAVRNIITDSPFKTPLSFVISGLPVLVVYFYLEKTKHD